MNAASANTYCRDWTEMDRIVLVCPAMYCTYSLVASFTGDPILIQGMPSTQLQYLLQSVPGLYFSSHSPSVTVISPESVYFTVLCSYSTLLSFILHPTTRLRSLLILSYPLARVRAHPVAAPVQRLNRTGGWVARMRLALCGPLWHSAAH